MKKEATTLIGRHFEILKHMKKGDVIYIDAEKYQKNISSYCTRWCSQEKTCGYKNIEDNLYTAFHITNINSNYY